MTNTFLKVQISIGEAGGFEFVTDLEEAAIIAEILTAKEAKRLARIAPKDPDLPLCIFDASLFCGIVILPVRVAGPQRT